MNSSERSPSREPQKPGFRPPLWVMLLVLAFVLVPFLFWRGTWFGRTLTEAETEKYLADAEHPRKTQHALVQIAERIIGSDPTVKRWYPQVVGLTAHESPEIRSTVAWVMGQDNQAQDFHQALRRMLDDSNPLVRRNAALSLVRFADASGKHILAEMLQPVALPSPGEGTLSVRLKEGDPVNVGTLLGRIRRGEQEQELRSPLPGRVEKWLAADGAAVGAGEPLVKLAPGEDQAWEALRALYLVGAMEDLPEVERFARGVPGMSDKVSEQARLTAEAIRRRAATEAGVKTD